MSAVQLAAFGRSLSSLSQWEVTGSTYDPDGGAVQGLTGLDRNLEVRRARRAVRTLVWLAVCRPPWCCLAPDRAFCSGQM